ncbi:uncharacterized protein BDZ99DRAFT_554488 [Mytilinidion resinicola]|uniref:Uncharacterized protein n=1 Tax=Mytilinidion resinicola TaxID=574789 RepID=A0A6A6Z1U4_9PEZI|nr:uncharacterized protein BDZ99DRAFT_554488 [Mytilinidion resinicola]KAF2814155.1 hypothetical protein BDZ99DRAFT_554488 [Mytilinidion resinicola]
MPEDGSATEATELNTISHGPRNVLQPGGSPAILSNNATSPPEGLVEPVCPIGTHLGRDSNGSQSLSDCVSNQEASLPRNDYEQGPPSGVATSIPRTTGGDKVSSLSGASNASEEDIDDSEPQETTISSSASRTLITGSV